MLVYMYCEAYQLGSLVDGLSLDKLKAQTMRLWQALRVKQLVMVTMAEMEVRVIADETQQRTFFRRICV